MSLRTAGLLLILAALLMPASASAQSLDRSAASAASRGAAAGATKQVAKRIILPATIVMAAIDSAEAYEQNCVGLADDQEAVACTASAFTEQQVEELKQLAQDMRIAWKYVVVPEAKEAWRQHGPTVVEGAKTAYDAASSAVKEYGPRFFDWLVEKTSEN